MFGWGCVTGMSTHSCVYARAHTCKTHHTYSRPGLQCLLLSCSTFVLLIHIIMELCIFCSLPSSGCFVYFILQNLARGSYTCVNLLPSIPSQNRLKLIFFVITEATCSHYYLLWKSDIFCGLTLI